MALHELAPRRTQDLLRQVHHRYEQHHDRRTEGDCENYTGLVGLALVTLRYVIPQTGTMFGHGTAWK